MPSSTRSRSRPPTPAPPWQSRPGAAEGRWRDRPVLAAAVRLVSFGAPLAASVVAAWVVAGALPAPHGLGPVLAWWGAVVATSLAVMVLFDRLARRLLPLAALLQLSLIFPDRAPSRVGVALRSGSTRGLHERAAAAVEAGQEPAEAARTILELAASLNAHDRGTRGHSERVRAYAELIATELGLSHVDRDRLRWAALLHDVGKLAVPSSTLNSHEALSDHDWEVLRRHPEEGARLAAPLRDWLGPWVLAIEQHHERYDGRGYPHGVAGDQLSLAARIVAVADAYDAMTSVRAYSPGAAPEVARQELARQAGTHFDPVVVRAFLNVAIGRLRWVMGPLAFFSAMPLLTGLGPLRRAVSTAGRTAMLGTVTLIGTVALIPATAPAPPLLPGGGASPRSRAVGSAHRPPEQVAEPATSGEQPVEPGGDDAASRAGDGDRASPAPGPRRATAAGAATTPAPGSPAKRPAEPANSADPGRPGARPGPPGRAASPPPGRHAPPPPDAPGPPGQGNAPGPPAAGACAGGCVFGGFLPPVSGTGTNTARAGSAIPFKWKLHDAAGDEVTDPATVAGRSFSESATDEAASYGPVRYDATAGSFVMVVKTPRSWTGTRVFTLTMADGNAYTATFTFT